MWIAIQNAVGARQGVGGGPGPGPGPDPVPSLPVGFAAAYSVRKLDSAYAGPCLEAYRVSDGATQDIGFDSNGDLDTASIISFAGGGEVRVRTWYDQSGNGVDATQTTDTFMPRIYDGSAIYEENGKPTLAWTVSGQHMDTTPNESITAQSNFIVFNMKSGSGGFARVLAQAETGEDDYFAGQYSALLRSSASSAMMATYNGSSAPTVSLPLDNQYFWTAIANGTSSEVWVNSGTTANETAALSSTLNMANLTIRTIGGAAGFNQDRLVGNIQEVLIYNTDQESAGNRNGIEYNINDYYSVFNSVNPMPASSSGLLFDYPDASAAYSVRQLNNNATVSMRVRRAVPPYDEQDIGFTAGGDLDEAAIVAFGGSDVLTVSGWYDQTGNQNHATQITPNSQPQIYNGTAVVTENGKPALQIVSGSPTNLNLTSVSANTLFAVAANTNNSSLPYITWKTSDSEGFFSSGTSQGFGYYDGGVYRISDSVGTGQGLGYFRLNSSGYDIAANGATVTTLGSRTSAMSFNYIFRDLSGLHATKIQEIISYGSDQSSNRTGIETDINTYFSIYT